MTPELKKKRAAHDSQADDEFLTPKEVARLLNVGERTIYRYALDGTLPAITLRKAVKCTHRFSKRALDKWLEERGALAGA